MLRQSYLIVLWLLIILPLPAVAHDLPISEMNIVADQQTLHVEFLVNTAELQWVSELDRNENGQVEYAELAPAGQRIARRVLELLTISVDGRAISVDACGILPNPDTHHIAVRAHYPVDARRAPVTVKSRLFSILPSAHVMQVTFRRPRQRYKARLCANAPEVEFASHTPPGN